MYLFSDKTFIIMLLFMVVTLNMLLNMKLHISSLLLSMEYLSVVLAFLMLTNLFMWEMSISLFFLFLCLNVGEASLGLSLLVKMARVSSKELSKFNLN